jgi:hypothetical protein
MILILEETSRLEILLSSFPAAETPPFYVEDVS